MKDLIALCVPVRSSPVEMDIALHLTGYVMGREIALMGRTRGNVVCKY